MGGYAGSAGSGAGILDGLTALGRTSLWALPLLCVGDTPASTTDQPENNDSNLYLYRNMRSVGNLPMLGNSLNTLGVRNKDFPSNIFGQFKSNTDYVYGSSGEGMSTTPGIGSFIPPTPFGAKNTTLFRINASNVYKAGLNIYIDKPNHANIIPRGRMTLQQFNMQIQATAPLWQPVR